MSKAIEIKRKEGRHSVDSVSSLPNGPGWATQIRTNGSRAFACCNAAPS